MNLFLIKGGGDDKYKKLYFIKASHGLPGSPAEKMEFFVGKRKFYEINESSEVKFIYKNDQKWISFGPLNYNEIKQSLSIVEENGFTSIEVYDMEYNKLELD